MCVIYFVNKNPFYFNIFTDWKLYATCMLWEVNILDQSDCFPFKLAPTNVDASSIL